LFGFYAANQLDKEGKRIPVQVFTFASPLVGDANFRKAFMKLERSGRIEHARFCNSGDFGKTF